MTFKERLASMGFNSYKEYLNGDHWKDFKCRYRASSFPQACLVCGSRLFDFHHINYANMPDEKFEDVIPLCHRHHGAVHAWLKANKCGVHRSKDAVEELVRRRSGQQHSTVKIVDWDEKIAELERSLEDRHNIETTRFCIERQKLRKALWHEMLPEVQRLRKEDLIDGQDYQKFMRRGDVERMQRVLAKLPSSPPTPVKPAVAPAWRYKSNRPTREQIAEMNMMADLSCLADVCKMGWISETELRQITADKNAAVITRFVNTYGHLRSTKNSS